MNHTPRTTEEIEIKTEADILRPMIKRFVESRCPRMSDKDALSVGVLTTGTIALTLQQEREVLCNGIAELITAFHWKTSLVVTGIHVEQDPDHSLKVTVDTSIAPGW